MSKLNITCIGGGHGLGHLLSVLKQLDDVSLTGIVCTTDNGGSTGRLRAQNETISWGDIRHCLSKLSETSSTKSLMFEYRFEQAGDLSGHSLGNLMCCAVDSLCIRPTDSVKVMSQFLDINASILPMSDQVTNLVAYHDDGNKLFGELAVDAGANKGLSSTSLEPEAATTPEVVQAIEATDILLIGPGSFYTSIVPNFLTTGLVEMINKNTHIKVFFISNVQSEFAFNDNELKHQLDFLKSLGLKQTITAIVSNNRSQQFTEVNTPIIEADIAADEYGRHDAKALKQFFVEFLPGYT